MPRRVPGTRFGWRGADAPRYRGPVRRLIRSPGGPRGGTRPVEVGRDTLPTRGQWLALAGVALLVIAADQVTKAIVRAELALGEEVRGFGPYAIEHVRNSGIAHGLFPGIASEVAVFTGIVVVGMLGYFARNGGGSPLAAVAFGLLVGGSVGNLADRVRLGYVTDFIDPDRGGTFNVADVSIMLGLGLMLVMALAGGPRPEAADSPRSGS